jgi:hypothetical protein
LGHENGAVARREPENRRRRPPDRLPEVSIEEQGADPQLDGLRASGCDPVCAEHASGADRIWPVLTGLLRDIRPCTTAGGQIAAIARARGAALAANA